MTKYVALFNGDKVAEIETLAPQALTYAISGEFNVTPDISVDMFGGENKGRPISSIVVATLEESTEGVVLAEDIPNSRISACKEQYFKRLRELVTKHPQPAELLCPGVEPFFEALSNAGIPVGVYTTRQHDIVRHLVEQSGLGRYVGRCDSGADLSKVLPQAVDAARNDLGDVLNENVVVFTYRVDDAASASALGYRAVGLAPTENLFALGRNVRRIYRSVEEYSRILEEQFDITE